MKAQISFVEFLTAMVVFISFVGYFSLQVLLFIPSYMNEIKSERLKSEAFQVSELLINDPNLGLSDLTQNKTNLLSANRIRDFNTTCQNYNSAKEKIGMDYDFSLGFRDIDTGTVMINCAPPSVGYKQLRGSIRRVVAFDDGGVVKFGEMVLQVW